MNKSLHYIFSLFPNPRDAFIFLYLLSLADDNGVVQENVTAIARNLNIPKTTMSDILKRLSRTYGVCTVVCTDIRKGAVVTISNLDNYKDAVCTDVCTSKDFTPNKVRTKGISELSTSPDTKTQKRPRFQKPTIEEVRTYVNDQNYSFSPEAFYDFYEANGWVQGKGKPIRSWQAACRTWQRYNTTSTKPMSTALKQQDLNFADDKQNDW